MINRVTIVLVLLLFAAAGLAADQFKRNGQLIQSNQQLQTDLSDQSQQITDLIAWSEQTHQLLADTERQRREARRQLSHTQGRLSDALRDDQCAAAELPGDIADRLRNIGGGEAGGDP
jgi:chromosome segregation ATPase